MKHLALILLLPMTALSARGPLELTPAWHDYFSAEIEAIQRASLSEVKTLEEWKQQREVHRRQLLEMLGLWPLPERTPLNAVVTGTLDHEALTVEKLHFQASPGLYVTANLYLPKSISGKVPAILYVCGHNSGVFNGIICGNKAGYQRHGGWFARNGYACLIIDTIQYGEVRGAHRGTYSEGQWWWNSRGYTPAGIEAWFSMRALDYLCSRPEVDADRIGMTGRSGGGAYSWTVAAVDDRVKVAAPIAGMTDLRNHVLDGAVDRHCDCMFQLNTYRWDYPMIGALIAPRPLLLGNSDKDAIFPLDGVVRVHEQIRHIYGLYKQTDKFGLLITEGDHKDTQDLQVPVFRWFNRFLKKEDPLIEMAAVPLFEPEQLRVFDTPPEDALNATAPEWFASGTPLFAQTSSDLPGLRAALRKTSFSGWPADKPVARLVHLNQTLAEGEILMHKYEVPIQRGVTQPLYILNFPPMQRAAELALYLPDPGAASATLLSLLAKGDVKEAGEELRRLLPDAGSRIAVFVPRGVGDDLFSTKESDTRMRRRFMLVGQTLDSMRVWDIRSAIAALRQLPGMNRSRISLHASGPMAVNAAFAALFDPVDKLELSNVPEDFRDRPDYFRVLKIIEHVPLTNEMR
jgi:dienelactone hydrolase